MSPASNPSRGPPSAMPSRAVNVAQPTAASAGQSLAANGVTPASPKETDTSQWSSGGCST